MFACARQAGNRRLGRVGGRRDPGGRAGHGLAVSEAGDGAAASVIQDKGDVDDVAPGAHRRAVSRAASSSDSAAGLWRRPGLA